MQFSQTLCYTFPCKDLDRLLQTTGISRCHLVIWMLMKKNILGKPLKDCWLRKTCVGWKNGNLNGVKFQKNLGRRPKKEIFCLKAPQHFGFDEYLLMEPLLLVQVESLCGKIPNLLSKKWESKLELGWPRMAYAQGCW